MCCVLFAKDREHTRRQTGKVSASIVIAENAQVHRDQQAFFSNEKNETNSFCLLTNDAPPGYRSSCRSKPW